MPENDKSKLRFRQCVSCRKYFDRTEMLRLTIDSTNHKIVLNLPENNAVFGRSAYLCAKSECLEPALKGGRLKSALMRVKSDLASKERQFSWPLESQLIHTMRLKCAENLETCHNNSKEVK